MLFVPGVGTYAAMHGTLFRRLVMFMLWWSICLVLVELGLNVRLATAAHSAVKFLQVETDSTFLHLLLGCRGPTGGLGRCWAGVAGGLKWTCQTF